VIEAGLDVERRDIIKRALTAHELRQLLSEIGKRPFDVISKRSTSYRDLGLASRPVSDDELIQLMAEHPRLLLRPILIADDEIVIGFDRAEYDRVIAGMGAK
jgi:arsenate reductase